MKTFWNEKHINTSTHVICSYFKLNYKIIEVIKIITTALAITTIQLKKKNKILETYKV